METDRNGRVLSQAELEELLGAAAQAAIARHPEEGATAEQVLYEFAKAHPVELAQLHEWLIHEGADAVLQRIAWTAHVVAECEGRS